MAERVWRVRRMAMVVGLALALAAGTAACGGDDGGGDNLPQQRSPDNESAAPTTPTEAPLDPADAEAWADIQTRFDAFMETWIKWAAEGLPGGFVDPGVAELGEYAEAFLFNEVGAELQEDIRNGRVRTGRPEWRDARLLNVDWDRQVQDRVIPEAVFEVCVDDSDWIVVDVDTGEPVGVEPAGAQVWTITAWWAEEREFGPDGWALAERQVDGSRSC